MSHIEIKKKLVPGMNSVIIRKFSEKNILNVSETIVCVLFRIADESLSTFSTKNFLIITRFNSRNNIYLTDSGRESLRTHLEIFCPIFLFPKI